MRVDRVKFAAALARADMTSKRLSELSGVSPVTISQVKNGKSCKEETAKKLIAVLGADITAANAGMETAYGK